jgi:acyl-CoA reductase-like NAD-dependent aldehyde dehydrogenase
MNAGQYCCGTERIYVMSDIYDDFVNEVVLITQSLIQTNDYKGDVGPTFWDKQIDIIEDHVNDAIAKGAKVLAGGKRNPSFGDLHLDQHIANNLISLREPAVQSRHLSLIDLIGVLMENFIAQA